VLFRRSRAARTRATDQRISSDTTASAVDTAARPPQKEPPDVKILKLLHAAALARWTNRRDLEWKLNYALWASLAGLAVTLLITKDAPLPSALSGWLSAILALVVLTLQLLYVVPITSRVICEIELQSDIEHALAERLRPNTIDTKWLGSGMRSRCWYDKHFGVLAPLAVTATLLFIVAWLLAHRPVVTGQTTTPSPPSSSQSPPPTSPSPRTP
jgi:hypothetical protein